MEKLSGYPPEGSQAVVEALALLLLVWLVDSLLPAVSPLVDSLLLAESVLLAESPLAGLSVFVLVSSLPTVALLDFRLSVIYQPEPLKTMPTGWKTRRTAPAHEGQVRSGSSLKD
jgi:hypothetical protein